MKKQILTINECFSDNLGDQAIARSLNSLLEREGYEVIQADYTGNTLASEDSVSLVVRGNLKNKLINLVKKIEIIRLLGWCLKSYKSVKRLVDTEYDFAVIGGGQLILNNAHFPPALFLWTLLLKKRNKDIYLFAVGCGDSFSYLNNYLIRKSLLRVKSIFVRDQVSHDKLKNIFNLESTVIPDVAYSFPKTVCTNDAKCNEINIVGIVDYNVFVRYAKEVNQQVVTEFKYMEMWLEKINLYKLTEVTLVATTYTDLEQSRRFYRFLMKKKPPFKIKFVDSLLSLDEYCCYLQSSMSVFSGRMHSLILGEIFESNLFVWPISQKIVSYQNEVNNYDGIDIKDSILKCQINKLVSSYT